MSKRTMFFINHLICSLAFALIFIAWIFFIWYPEPLAKALGVVSIFLLIVIIDVIIGPIIGLIIYKEQKKYLKLDLTIVIFIQVFAMCYGVFSVFQGRPVWIVYNGNNRFELTRSNEVYTGNLWQAKPVYQYVSWLKPKLVSVKIAKSQKEYSQTMFDEVFGGILSTQRPEKFTDLSEVKDQLIRHAQALPELNNYNNKNQVKKVLSHYSQADAWMPLKTNNIDMVVLINKKTGNVVQIVDLRPWKI